MDNRAFQNGSDGGSDSPYDGLQENDTEDSFGRRMIREMRAENPRPQAFRRARPRLRHGLTMENLERVPVAKGGPTPEYVQRQAGSVTSSGDSRASDPPPNVPKSWGGRSRKPEWLKRRFAAEVEAFSEALKTGTTDTIDWSAIAVDIPLPSVEDTPLSHKSSRRSTPAADSARKNTKLDDIMRLEQEEDFSMTNLITSTPAIISRGTKLDEIRRLELENAISDAVDESVYPTPPPEKAVRRRSSTSKRDRVRSRSPGRDGDMVASWSHPAEQEIVAQKRDDRHSTPKRLPNDAPQISSRNRPHIVDNAASDMQLDLETNLQRPSPHREDSQDILRRLARAASNTPSPSRVAGTAINALSPKKNKQTRFNEQKEGAAPKFEALSSGDSAPKQPDSAAKPDENIASKGLPQSQEVQLRDARRQPLSEVTLLENPPPKGLEPKTPVVTGAWIETPKPTTNTSHRPQSDPPTTSTAKQDDESKSTKPEPARPAAAPNDTMKPHLPSSALTAVLSTENGLGDSTITSLEDILGRPPSHLDEDTLTTLDLTTFVPKTPAEALRYKELLTLRKMNAQLRATRDSIRDAKLGIGRVERAVHAADSAVVVGAGAEVGSAQQCKHCGHHLLSPSPPTSPSLVSAHGHAELETANAPLIAIFISLKGIVWYVSPSTGRKRLTWLALLTIVFWAWFWAEFLACLVWCRPVYSRWDGRVRPEAPEWPFVIPTVVFAPFRFVWEPVLDGLGRWVWPGVRWIWEFICFLWEDERLKEEWRRAAARTAKGVVSTVTREWMGVPTGDSMDNDELL